MYGPVILSRLAGTNWTSPAITIGTKNVRDRHLDSGFPDPLPAPRENLREVKEQERADAECRHDCRRCGDRQLRWIGQAAQPPERRNAEHDQVGEREREEDAGPHIARAAQPRSNANGEVDHRRSALRDSVDRGESRCGKVLVRSIARYCLCDRITDPSVGRLCASLIDNFTVEDGGGDRCASEIDLRRIEDVR